MMMLMIIITESLLLITIIMTPFAGIVIKIGIISTI